MRLPRKRKREHMGVRPEARDYPQHREWVRKTHECACAGKSPCQGKMQAHHVKENTGAGTGLKSADWWCVPLCAGHHAEAHNPGWRAFERKYGFSMREMAEGLARISPHRWRWSEAA